MPLHEILSIHFLKEFSSNRHDRQTEQLTDTLLQVQINKANTTHLIFSRLVVQQKHFVYCIVQDRIVYVS